MKKKIITLLSIASLSGLCVCNGSAINKYTNVAFLNDEFLALSLSTNDLVFETAQTTDLIQQNLIVTGETNAANGYKISFSTNTGHNQLKHKLASVSTTIPSVSETTVAASFPTLGWGYSIDETIFNEIPISEQNLFNTNTLGSNSYDFVTGVRVAESIVSGSYSNTLLFTIVANDIPSGSKTITYLQEMTPKICQQTPVGYTGTLIDIRDNKKYPIKKISNGNCWIASPLELELSTSTTLTPDDTNITSNWTPSISAIRYGINDSIDYLDDYNTPFSIIVTSYDLDDDTGAHDKTIDYYEYTWLAAVASNSDDPSYSQSWYEAPNSICPKGWELPKSFSTTDYTTVFERTTNEADAININYYGGWTSTVVNDGQARGLRIWGTPYAPNYSISKTEYHGVYCVAKNPINHYEYTRQ